MAFDGRHDPYRTIDPSAAKKRVRANKRGLPYAVDNRLRQEEIREKICYQNGATMPPRAKEMFLKALYADLDARGNSAHAKILRNNLLAAGQACPAAKPAGHAVAHHIVASGDDDAADSRDILFGWGVGINDAANGVFLPRYKISSIPAHPAAPKHSQLHTRIYHHQVFIRLDAAATVNATDKGVGQSALREIRESILQGSFPYRGEHLA